MSGDAMDVKNVAPGYASKTGGTPKKAGYKQTEIGALPEDWDLRGMSDIAWFQEGPGVRNSQFTRSGVKLFNGTNIQNGKILLERTDRYISLAEAYGAYSHFLAERGDIVIACSGITVERFDEKVSVIDSEHLPLCMNTSTMRFQVIDNNVLSPFLFQFLRSSLFKLQIAGSVTGSAQLNFGPSHVSNVTLPIPPIEEQRAIATALSDVDALLEELDRLIAKKRDLKQATMQQLLTGQTRLPGFEGEWRRIQIGDIGRTYGGLIGKSKGDFGTGSALFVPFINVMENTLVDCQKLERVRVTEKETQNRVMKGDVLFNGSSETPEEVAMCALMTQDIPHLYLNSFCFGYRIGSRDVINSLYFVYLIRSHTGRKLIQSLAQGSTRYNISKTALLEAEIELPDLEEQIAISQIIKDMEDDILILDERRNKAAALKQAMMQELLTGRSRLV